MTSSEIRVFQSIGEAGSGLAPIAVLSRDSVAESGSPHSEEMIIPQSVSEIFLSHVRTSAIEPVGALKKSG